MTYQQQNHVVIVDYLCVITVRKREIVFVVLVQKNVGRVQIMSTDYLHKYPLVEFRQDVEGKKIKRKGALVGEWLLITFPSTRDEDANTYKIFHFPNGKPVINATFLSIDDAFGMAETLDKVYGEFFPIWTDYPDADILGMTQWTVRNGVNLYKIAKEMAHKNKVTKLDVRQIFHRYGVI